MRAAVIENGKVTNIIVVESLDIFPNLVDAEGANIGDDWDGVQFVKPPTPPTPDPTPPRMTEEEKEALLLAQSEMIALLFERLQGGSVQ